MLLQKFILMQKLVGHINLSKGTTQSLVQQESYCNADQPITNYSHSMMHFIKHTVNSCTNRGLLGIKAR